MKQISLNLVFFFIAMASAQAGEIVVRPTAVPKTSVVRLGDVAEIRGVENGTAERLAALPLLPAPTAPRFMRQREVQDMLEAHGENMLQWRVTGAAQVTIQPRTATTTGTEQRDNKADRREALQNGHAGIDTTAATTGECAEQIRAAIAEYLATQSGATSGWNIELSLGDRQKASVAAATSPLTCVGGLAPWTGRQRFEICFTTADGPAKMALLADVKLTQSIVVAARPLARGAMITAADLDIQTMDNPPVTGSRRSLYHSVEDLLGMEAGRPIQAGEVVFSDQVASPILVKRGEAITVVAQGGGIRVRTSARARQDGARGDLVQVESLESKERYDARVTGVKEVSVLAPTSTEAPAAVAQNTQPAEREATPFRRYQQPSAKAPQTPNRTATAFRKLADQDGKQNGQVR